MKTKFLLLLLLTILLQVNTSSFAREMKSARQIELRTKTPAQHRSIPITPVAFIEDALVTIDLLSTVPTATVVVKDAQKSMIPSVDSLSSIWTVFLRSATASPPKTASIWL